MPGESFLDSFLIHTSAFRPDARNSLLRDADSMIMLRVEGVLLNGFID